MTCVLPPLAERFSCYFEASKPCPVCQKPAPLTSLCRSASPLTEDSSDVETRLFVCDNCDRHVIINVLV